MVVWITTHHLYVLSYNEGMGYAGLVEYEQPYDGHDWEITSEVFDQNIEDNYPGFFDRSDAGKRNILMEHL